jgi:hypothetical protein
MGDVDSGQSKGLAGLVPAMTLILSSVQLLILHNAYTPKTEFDLLAFPFMGKLILFRT